MDSDRDTSVSEIDKKGLIMGVLALLVGIGLLVYSYFTIKTYNEKNSTYVETESTVVDYKYDINEEGQELRAIIVEYTVDGRTYKKESGSFSTITESIGSKVMIKYDPINPSDSIWKNDSSNIVIPIVGGAFVICGILIFVNYKKQNKKDKLPI